MNEDNIKRKVVLVTGGAKGIGKAILLKFAKEGYDCVLNYNTSINEANETNNEIVSLGVKCLMVKADISKEEEVDQMFIEIENTFGGADIIINNAGVDIDDLFDRKSVDTFRYTLDVNLIGPYMVCKRGYKYMKEKKWGRVINISSTNGINTYFPMCLEYDASKAALNSLTHNLALQFSPYITVNAIAPGFIGTDEELKGYDEEFLHSEVEKILVKRIGKPEEVANLVFFLASDMASYINNSIIRIDGGQYGS